MMMYLEWDDTLNMYQGGSETISLVDVSNISNTIGSEAVVDSAITYKKLTGLPTPSNVAVANTDTILQAIAKLQGQINAKSSAVPTAFTWTNGTTAGPTGSLTGTGMSAVSYPAIPAASATTSGIVTTGDQVFKGTKTFAGSIVPQTTDTTSIGSSSLRWAHAYVDYVHGALQGNADTATKLATPRNIALTGAVTGSASFDGSANTSISTTLANFDASKITSGTIDIDRLPKGALERLFVVASQSAAVTLVTSGEAQEGDTVQITGENNTMYFVVDATATTFANIFREYTAGAATSVPWSGVTSKPTFATVATSGSYNDLLNKPTIPSAYVLPTASSTTLGGVKIGSGISISSGVISATYSSVGAAAASHTHTASQVSGLATVATSGSYNDLSNKPTIPSLTGYATQSWVQSQGYLTSVPAQTWDSITNKPSTFTPSAHTQAYTTLTGSTTTANQAIVSSGTTNGWALKTLGSNAFNSTTIPTKTSQLTNDSGFLTSIPTASTTVTGGIKLNGSSTQYLAGNGTFYTIAYSELSGTPTIPSTTSDLTNDSGFITTSALSGYATQSWVNSQGFIKSYTNTWRPIKVGSTTLSDSSTTLTVANGTGISLSFASGTLTITNSAPGTSYTLPAATSSTLGGVKIGSNISVSSGTISLTSANVTSALGFTPAKTSDIPEIPIALPNPYALTINGTSYTGSLAVSITTPKALTYASLGTSVSAGYIYYNSATKTISSFSGFSLTNADAVIYSSAKITFSGSCRKMDGLADLSGSYYIYCLSWMPTSSSKGIVCVNGAVYA